MFQLLLPAAVLESLGERALEAVPVRMTAACRLRFRARPLLAPLLCLACLAAVQTGPGGRQSQVPAMSQAAMRARQAGNLAEAIRLYGEIVKIDPASAEMWANRGVLLFEAGRWREALDSLTRATTLKPELFTPHLYSGMAWLRLGQAARARDPLEHALALDPDSVPTRVQLGNASAALGDMERAVNLYKEVLTRRPRFVDGWYRLGVAWMQWAVLEGGKLASQRRSPYGRILLGDSLAAAGDSARAQRAYREAAELSGGDPEVRAVVDRALLGLRRAGQAGGSPPGDPEREIDTVLPAVLGPEPPDGARYRFTVAARQLARRAFDRLLELDPDSYQAHLLQAQLAAEAGDNAVARLEYEKALAKDPSDPQIRYRYVAIVRLLRDFQGARAAAESALAKFPGHAGLNTELGLILLEQGAAAAANARFRQALALDPASITARSGLADSLAAQGDPRAAAAQLERVLDSDPDGSFHYKIGRWYRELGDDAKAEAAFAAAQSLKDSRAAKP